MTTTMKPSRMNPIIEDLEGDAVETPEPEAGPDETKGEAFIRLMNHRVTNARKFMRLIGNLSNRSAYDYDAAQVAKALEAVGEAFNRTAAKFADAQQPKRGNGDDFEL